MADLEKNEENITITLEFDNDEKIEAEPLFIFDVNGKDYVALIPVDEESEDVFLFVYNELENDEFEFLDIESDEEFELVSKEFERIIEETEAEGSEEK